VAERYSTEHHELIVRPELLEVLPTLVTHYGEPYADSSAIPTYYVAKLTRQHVTVALNGDGGDESLAGYERYLGSLVADRYLRLPRALRTGLIEPAARLIPSRLPRFSRLGQTKRFLSAAALSSALRYQRWMTYFTPVRKAQMYTPEFRKRMNGSHREDWLAGLLESFNHGSQDALDTMLAADVSSYLPFDLLVKMDIASMANALETRSPFLDHEVMQFCARLPVEFKIRGRTLKYLLRKVAADLIPPANIHRRKMGFGVPVGEWMRRDRGRFLESVLFSPKAQQRSYFDIKAIRTLVNEHLAGSEDHSQRLWSLLWLEQWHRTFVD
jgi:asparagine synthase (glutamine-hydrolysing)